MAGYRKDAIFVQLLLFHIAVYPIMLIYFNPGISLIFIGILEFIFIFQVSYFLSIYYHILSGFTWLILMDMDSSWWTWIGQNGYISGATEWESLLNGFSVLSHFIVTVLWTLLRNLYKMVPVILQHFFDISTKWFYPKKQHLTSYD